MSLTKLSTKFAFSISAVAIALSCGLQGFADNETLKPTEREARRQQAVQLSQNPEDFPKAKAMFEQLLKEHEDTDSLLDMAAFAFKSNYDECYKLCAKAEKLNNGKHYTIAVAKLGQAESKYRNNELKSAAALYLDSLNSLTAKDGVLAVKLDLIGLAADYFRMGEYEKSRATYEELYRLDRDAFGVDDIECGWALLQESHALKECGKIEEAQKCWNRAIWIFRKVNEDNIASEYKKQHNGKMEPEVAARLHSMLYGKKADVVDPDPISPEHCKYSPLVQPIPEGYMSPWKRQFKQTEAPGFVWLDPSIPVKSIVVCVHGLGLHHHSFDSFARRAAKEGIMTIAFDVRGFGTYVDANGLEKLSMDENVEDLRQLTAMLRKDYAEYPLFLLGESMGGALALRVVAKSPENVDGLICSVPSGSRHKTLASTLSSLKVGAEFVKNRSKPIDVLTVVNQSTQDEELRKAWKNDPFSRLKITPAELVNFQLFMDQNPNFAKQITSKPVILYQGNDDKLVKESGTLDLFQSIGSKEKTLVLLGGTEHLIFEAKQFKDDVSLGVIGWMIAHSPAKMKAQAQPEADTGNKIDD